MAISEYGKYDALGLAALVAKKKVKPSELLEEAISRAEKLNPKLNAIVYKDYENARRRTKVKLRGPFAGVPFLLKDIFALSTTMPTRQASKFMPAMPWISLNRRVLGRICSGCGRRHHSDGACQ